MSNALIIFIYSIAAYGICNMIVFGSGPFKIFEKIREWSYDISEHFSSLFSCMMCLPANIGWITSLINWFFIPVKITPFNLLLAGTNLWWVALICDCCFTSGIVWIIHNIESFFENIMNNGSDIQDENNDVLNLHD